MKMTELKRPLIELKQSELHELRQLFSSEKNIEEWLHSNGWFEIGSGYYSTAYGNDSSPFIIKVLTDRVSARNAESLRCGVTWLRFCQKNYHTNPHFMKVFYVQTNDVGNGLKYYAVIEKLKPLGYSHFREILEDPEMFVAMCILDPGRWLIIKILGDDYHNYKREIEKDTGKSIENIFQDNVSQNHAFSVAVLKVLSFKEKNCWIDININNLMFRNGTLVFTDPLHG